MQFVQIFIHRRRQAMNRMSCLGKPAIITLVALVVFFMATGCSQEDDADVIRALIQKGAELAEAHDVNGVMALAAEDVVAHPGAHGRREIKRIIWMAFKHYGDLKILYPRPSVDLFDEGRRASCRLVFLIVKKDRVVPDVKDLYDDPKGWIETVGENADLYRLELEMLKTGKHWLVEKAHLETFKGTGFDD